MSGLIPESTLDQIRAASDIVDVVGSYVPLKRAGANWVALCPFHREKSPSFNVNPQRQTFKCFGCQKGGNVFTFVKEFENITFVDAVRRLAERASIPLEMDSDPAQAQSRHIKDILLTIHEQITHRWQQTLANDAAGQPARDYLASRGVTEEAIKLFRLGAASDLWDDTVNWAKSKGHDLAHVEQAGLILRKEGSDHYYDRFRGRLMFPICDDQGRVVGFSGRVLTSDVQTAKYVNSPETPIFTKGRVFFGLDKSKRPLLDAQSAIVCEGQLDLIACFMAGIKNIVAPQGTALTADHARILKRYVEEVVLCFDGDKAGQNATVRSLDSLLAAGLAVRVAMVPSPHDPDSYIKEAGPEAFQEIIKNAEGFFDYYLKRLCVTNDIKSDRGRLSVLQDMAVAVQKTGNSVLVDTYAQKTALRLGVAVESVRVEFRKAGRAKTHAPAEVEEEIHTELPVEVPRPSAIEYGLVKYLLLHDEGIEWLKAHLDMFWIQNSLVREIVERRFAAQQADNWRGVAAFLDSCESLEIQNLVSEVTADPRVSQNLMQQLKDVTLRIRNDFLDRQITELKFRCAEPDLADPSDLLTQQAMLRLQKRQPLSPLGGEEIEPF